MKNRRSNVMVIMLLFFSIITSCSGGGDSDPNLPTKPEIPVTPPPSTAKEIRINTSVSPTDDTRATDTEFETNDKIGLFIVNHNTSDQSITLQTTGNHVDNMRFTYNGTWTPDKAIYWKDNDTKTDFYLYYPYISTIDNVTSIPFTVPSDQSSEASYKAGDFLMGQKKDVPPTDQAVSITANHLMSQIVITVAAGNGFTTESLAAAKVSVKINGIKTGSSINLSTASATATGDATSITPLLDSGNYKAIIVPQVVAEGNLITINVDGRDFNLKKAFTFESGKRHKFTVTVSKTSNGVNVSITQWGTDDKDNGGTAE